MLNFVVFDRFSLSKWIHVHNGDEGLKKFFERVYAVLNPGGFFVLEPQSWESYAKVKRMDPVWLFCRFD
jgi:7SK snRNA methylphosphate capping enzyme